MSDVPGPMTKHSLSAPPVTMRSSRYSLTAQGRSPRLPPRLPTGSNSLEKPSGWMRLPRPAAGMIPSISGALAYQRRAWRTDSSQRRFEFLGAPVGSVLGEHPLARSPTYFGEFVVPERQRLHHVVGRLDREHLAPELEEGLDARPAVGHDRGSAGGGFEQPARRAPAERRHGLPRDVQR